MGMGTEELSDEAGFIVVDEPLEPQPAPPAPVQFVSEEDRLRAENINLRLMNATQRETLIQHELNAAIAVRNECSAAVQGYREALSQKYNIDFDQYIIQSENGMIIPRPR